MADNRPVMAKPTSRPVSKPTGKPTGTSAPEQPAGPSWRVRLRLGLRYAFLLATAIILLHHNIVKPYLMGGQELHDDAAHAPVWLRPPAAMYHALIRAGDRAGLPLKWRMYSPVPKHLYYTELTAQAADGRWLPLSSPGLPKAYREQRDLLTAVLWDFKRARMNDNFFVYRYEPWLPMHYLKVTRDRIARELGQMPQAVRVRVLTGRIPPPSEKGDWRPERAVFDGVMWDDVYR
ncbi:MAG TPA: hypothetical protein VNM90_03975 [Haliangium sp.]|nr:hypothetical protein [Haliangium sp.]